MQFEKRILCGYIFQVFLKLRSNVAELSLFQLRLPEDWIRVLLDGLVYIQVLIYLVVNTYIESMLHPSTLFDMIQIDESTRVGIPMCSCEDASPTEFEGLFFTQIITIFSI